MYTISNKSVDVVEFVVVFAWLLSPVLAAVVEYFQTAREIRNH